MFVRAPASSANLGPGFDSLAVALAWHAELGLHAEGAALLPGSRLAEPTHPASVAFRRAGGSGEIWERPGIPMGRGLGYSGAVRVGGVVLAHAQRHGSNVLTLADARPQLLALAADLEGHPDNVAATLYGGVVVAAGGEVVRVPVAVEPTLVVWVPDAVTRTSESRQRLPAQVDFHDAVFNLGRAALLVAALASGEVGALRAACADRLHQNLRLAGQPASAEALRAAFDADVWAAWLSGSGPTVACLCAPEEASRVAASLPGDGQVRIVSIDYGGTVIEDGEPPTGSRPAVASGG